MTEVFYCKGCSFKCQASDCDCICHTTEWQKGFKEGKEQARLEGIEEGKNELKTQWSQLNFRERAFKLGVEEGIKQAEEKWKSTEYYRTQQHEAITNARLEVLKEIERKLHNDQWDIDYYYIKKKDFEALKKKKVLK